MKLCMLRAVILVILTKDLYAGEVFNQNNLITTYDPGETTTQAQIGPQPSRHGHMTTNDHGDHNSRQNGQIRLEDRIDDQPIKFEDDNDIEQIQSDSEFDDEGIYYENYPYLESKRFEGAKIKFEDSNDTSKDSKRETNDQQSHARYIVFEDNKTSGDNSKYYDYETEERPADKPIKFENNGKDSRLSTNNEYYDRNTVPGRISFTDDSNRVQEPVQKKKRKPRRKPPVQSQNPVQNSPHPGSPGAIKPGYPKPGYSSSGYPYPGNTYQNPSYPHPAYLGAAYSQNSGYGLYPASGYHGTGESRPSVYPGAYPNTGQGVQTGSRYPSQDNLGATQSGRPGASYPDPHYPYSQGYPVTGNSQTYPGDQTSQYGLQDQVQYRPPGIQHLGYQYGYYRPPRRPKSLPERAVSAVAEALTSIALYDDFQCVPRLLCESAGGSTTLPPTLLKATEGLQPLLTLLQAYNGVSSSPLFVFGRAAVTGMAAKGNPAACRQAYPQCPTDPEKLINYLNNHNGGFFRFFGQPAVPQQQQNLEQFYGYLSGQYGLQQQTQQNYGYPSPYRYGLLPQYPNANPNNYGNNYSYRNAKNDSEIEERIQNKPSINAFEDDNDSSSGDDQNVNSKWLFPEEIGTEEGSDRDRFKIKNPSKISTSGKGLKFPDDRSNDRNQNKPRDYVRKQKHVLFPKESYLQLYSNYYYQSTTPANEDYVFDHKHNFYVKRPKTAPIDDVVYVVRGNGDPNHPEIVKVRPGQSI